MFGSEHVFHPIWTGISSSLFNERQRITLDEGLGVVDPGPSDVLALISLGIHVAAPP
jgi:hypothetical protein